MSIPTWVVKVLSVQVCWKPPTFLCSRCICLHVRKHWNTSQDLFRKVFLWLWLFFDVSIHIRYSNRPGELITLATMSSIVFVNGTLSFLLALVHFIWSLKPSIDKCVVSVCPRARHVCFCQFSARSPPSYRLWLLYLQTMRFVMEPLFGSVALSHATFWLGFPRESASSVQCILSLLCSSPIFFATDCEEESTAQIVWQEIFRCPWGFLWDTSTRVLLAVFRSSRKRAVNMAIVRILPFQYKLFFK